MRSNPRSNGVALAVALFGAVSAAACSTSESSTQTAVRPCPTSADTILGGSVEAFVKTAQPTAYRYLVAVGTDSAIPDHGRWALQGRTPLFLYPRDPAQQKSFVAQLYSQRGNYVTLLVAYHGQDTLEDGRIRTELSGTYIGGRNDGKTIPRAGVVFDCHATGNRFSMGDAPIQADTTGAAKSTPPPS
jgi:hypothetical protein